MQAKKHALAWLAAGLLLSLLVFVVVLTGLSGGVVVTDPEGIPQAADMVMRNIQDGNWEALEAAVLGSPALAPRTGEADSAEALIWESYQESLQWTFQNGFDIQDAYVTQKITVTCLDIPGVTKSMSGNLDAEAAANPELKSQFLYAAAEQVLASECPVAEYEITLTFVREKGRWLLVPNSALQALLSGFTAH